MARPYGDRTSRTPHPGSRRGIEDLKRSADLPVIRTGLTSLEAFVRNHEPVFRTLLPEGIEPASFIETALHAVEARPGLEQATIRHLCGAFLACARMGLEPNSPLGLAFIAPWENERTGITEARVILGYRGMLELARRSGRVESILTRVVRENDKLKVVQGTEEMLRHIPCLTSSPGQPIAYYATAVLAGGRTVFELMSRAAVLERRDMSDAYQAAKRAGRDTAWDTHEEQMARKTPVRALFPYLPMTQEMGFALDLDRIAEANQSQNLDRLLAAIPDEEAGAPAPAEQALAAQERGANVLDWKALKAASRIVESPAESTPAPAAESSAAAPRLIDPAELEADLAQAEASWTAPQPAEAEPAQATATRRERRKPGTALLVIPEPPKDGPENPPLPLERPATAAA